MSRAQRLLALIQLLRGHRLPVAGAHLAAELGISLRTLYRDIGTLQEQGASIAGEAGLGYVLQSGFMLPPLMFSEEEIEALVLGSRWVADRGDTGLATAAKNALTKIAAVLPRDLRDTLDASSLLVGPADAALGGDAELAQLRQAIRAGRKIQIRYRDLKEVESTRTLWPFAMGYFERARVLVAWCELRQGFRHFRTDRIAALTVTEQRYPRRRQALLKEWRALEGMPPP
ncbi:MAG: YafY family transcriptional regulator [Betaproteobacteria bacterium]|nr:YafY family transcriptional regulator [Betaproteobacteria bacterium]